MKKLAAIFSRHRLDFIRFTIGNIGIRFDHQISAVLFKELLSQFVHLFESFFFEESAAINADDCSRSVSQTKTRCLRRWTREKLPNLGDVNESAQQICLDCTSLSDSY